jgi:hypothetical protein
MVGGDKGGGGEGSEEGKCAASKGKGGEDGSEAGLGRKLVESGTGWLGESGLMQANALGTEL